MIKIETIILLAALAFLSACEWQGSPGSPAKGGNFCPPAQVKNGSCTARDQERFCHDNDQDENC